MMEELARLSADKEKEIDALASENKLLKQNLVEAQVLPTLYRNPIDRDQILIMLNCRSKARARTPISWP